MTLTDYLSALTITQGRHAGDPFRVLRWQRQFVRGAFAKGASTAALSCGARQRQDDARSGHRVPPRWTGR